VTERRFVVMGDGFP